MSTESDCNRNRERFQFPLRALLLVVTAACVMFGLLALLLPESLPIEFRITIYVVYAVLLVYTAWMISKVKRRPWKTPTDFVTVKVDTKWKRRVSTPLVFGPVAALTGVSMTFAPLYLLSCGQLEEFGYVEWIAVPSCFLMIYFVPGFYMSLASEVIAELRKSESSTNGT